MNKNIYISILVVFLAMVGLFYFTKKSNTQNLEQTSPITFSGHIVKDQSFQKDIGEGLIFKLTPDNGGWNMDVVSSTDEQYDYGFASIATPPLHGLTALNIYGSDFDVGANRPQKIRDFSFVLNKKDANTMADAIQLFTSGKTLDFDPKVFSIGKGELVITNLKLSNLVAGSETSIESMDFIVNLHYPVAFNEQSNIPETQTVTVIKTGKISFDTKAFNDLQSAVLDGHQPWRRDPESVTKAELNQYGFVSDDLTSLNSVSAPKNGMVQYQIPHTNSDGYQQFYLTTLTQPTKGGIWIVSDIEINSLPRSVKSLDVHLFGENAVQTVTAYQIPTKEELAAYNYRIEVSSLGVSGNKNILFKENSVPFSGDPDLQLIKSSSGQEAVVVVEYPSAADGGREAWHILTAESGKIIRLDRSEFLKKPLIENDSENWNINRDYYVMAYAEVKVSGDEIIETIPTNPLPNGGKNVTLEFRFKFTGNSLKLSSVKKI